MGATIKISLKTVGEEKVKEALKTTFDAVVKFQESLNAKEEAASKKRIETFKNEAQEKAKIAKEIAKDLNGILGGASSSTRAAGGRSRKSVIDSEKEHAEKSFFESLKAQSGIVGGASSSMSDLMAKAGMAAAGIALLAGGISLAVEGLKAFSGFLIKDVVKPAWALETFAVQTENATNGAIKSNELMTKARSIQVKYNIDAMAAAQSIGEVTDKTGDAKLAMGMAETFAQLSKGYGMDAGQLARLTGAMYKKGMTAEDMKSMLFTQLGQGQEGKITLKEIANLGGTFSEKSGLLAGNSADKYAAIGAALQTGGITGKADVSMNNINKFIEEVVAGRLGPNSKAAKKGQVLDLGDAIREALVKSGGDASKFKSTMKFSDTSSSFLQQYIEKFNEEFGKNGHDAAKAAKAATEEFENMKKKAATEGQVRTAVAKVMRTAGEQYEKAMNQIKMRMTEAVPAINGLVTALVSRAPELASAALTLTRVFVACGKFLGKFIDEVDTRTQRDMEREEKESKEDDKITKANDKLTEAADKQNKLEEKLTTKQKEEEDIKKKFGVKSPEYKAAHEATKEVEEQLTKAKAESLKQTENVDKVTQEVDKNKAKIKEEFESKVTDQDIINKFGENFGKQIIQGVKERPEDFDTGSETMEYNTGGKAGMRSIKLTQEQMELRRKYRDQQLQEKEDTAAKGAASSGAGMQAMADAVKAAFGPSAKALTDAATELKSAGGARSGAPLADQGGG